MKPIIALFLSVSILAFTGTASAAGKQKAGRKAATNASLPDVRPVSEELTLLYGNSFIERIQEEGTLEALLQASEPDKRQQFRSLAYTGDEVGFRIRPSKFGDHLGYISRQLPCKRVVMGFGMNEAFAGTEGLEKFKADLGTYLDVIEGRHPGSKMILVSPTAVEKSDSGIYPDVAQRNADISNYSKAMEQVAKERGVEYVDLFSPSVQQFAETETPLTIDGMQLNDAGLEAIAKVLAKALASPEKVAAVDTQAPGFAALKELASRKSYEVAMAYHPANGIHYYGLRRRDYEYATEIPHHLKLANQLDEAMWQQAKNLTTAQAFPKLPTATAEPPPSKPRKGLGTIKTAKEDLADFTLANGFDVNLFASSEEFPELINPLQIHFDAKGRLWVCCFESYPIPVPGTLSNDKILIFEDTDGDGKADKRTVFADDLKLPDGFVFYKDGIIVAVARKLIWLRDTDGDDVADIREEWLRGADDTDTHHGGYLARTPQGHIIVNEALFHRGQFETPHGPVRTKDAATLYLDPDTRKLTIDRQTSHPNPWKTSYNRWGDSIQMFGGGQIIDCDFYNVWTPAGVASSGDMEMPFRDDKGCTIAFVSSPHFPEEWQGGVVTGHLLAKNAVLYTPLKLNGGIMEKAADSTVLLSSPNKSFRPTDLEFGLDGALYVSDFYYPIIGHAQHSIRDANRDYTHGRIWRITLKDTPLAKPPIIAGADIPSLIALLAHPQVSVREIARHELEKHAVADVLASAKSKISEGKANEEFGLELMWLFERLKDLSQPELFRHLAKSTNATSRRAAARSLRWWAPTLGDEAKIIAAELLKSGDERSIIGVISSASYLQLDDPSWREVIKDIEAPNNSPIDHALKLAALYDSPPISPEFPVLEMSPDTKISGWKMKKGGLHGAIWLKSEKAQALILAVRGNPFINLNVNDIPALRSSGGQFSKDSQISLDLVPGLNKIEFYSEQDGKPRKGPVNLYLADLTGSKPKGLSFAKNETEHAAWEKAYEDEFATVTDSRIYIKSVPAQLAYNVKSITVKAGRSYQFVFENPDHMLHNLVITKPGKVAEVGALADAMAADPDAMEKHYIPDTDLILFSTPQISQGAKVELQFTTPSEPGSYPFICTFPGHWRVMSGVMLVE